MTLIHQDEAISFSNKTPPSFRRDLLYIKLNEDQEKQFAEIAEILLNHYVLCTPKAKYRLAEIEFYYYNQVPLSSDDISSSFYAPPKYEDFLITGISHQDCFTHRHIRQMKNGYWYLHTNGEYLKQGKRKGIDLTIGDEYEFSYGSILVRAMQNMADSNDYIYGPSKVVDQLIHDLDRNEVNDIFDVQDISALDNTNKIFIEEFVLEKETIFTCFRH